jgi:nucleoside-diphosphate-sugar epimerase
MHFTGQANLSGAWGRIFYLYGPFEHPSRLIASVIRSLAEGRPAQCSHGKQVRDFLHVQDVSDAFVALLDSEVSGTINIASGCPITVKEIVHKIARKLEGEGLIRLGALPTPPDEPALLVANVQRLTHEVGWEPKYDLDKGLDDTITWWRKQLAQATHAPAN